MKVAFYAPSQHIVAKDFVFQKYMSWDFLNGSCDTKCDFIYCASISQLDAGLKAKATFKKPLVCWCWDIPDNWKEWKMPQKGIDENKFRDSKNNDTIQKLRRCNLVLSASKYTQSVLRKYGINSKHVYFYINTEELDKYRTEDRQNNVIQISRYYWNKKFEYTLQVCRNPVFYGTNIHSPYGVYIRKFAKAPIMHTDKLRGEVLRGLASSGLLVSPSCFEGWGITPIEAIYLDVPILVSDIPVMKEVWQDAGYYFKNHDVNDYESKLNEVIDNKELKKKIVRQCKTKITEFTPEKFANRWKKAVKSGI